MLADLLIDRKAFGGPVSDSKAPDYADLKGGVTGKDILEAINKSGYPFQAEVADIVRSRLAEILGSRTQEEWAYIDSESGNARTLDIFAEVPLWNRDEAKHDEGRAKPYLNILLECKQSDLPYILFLRGNSAGDALRFPEISGIKSSDLRMYMEEWQADRSSALFGKAIQMSIYDVFAFHDFQTFEGPLLQAVSLAKATRKGGQGGRLEISGEETYRGLTLPLLKAVDYLKEHTKPTLDAEAFFPRLIVSVAVVRAPLIGAYLHNRKTIMLATPWVRVSRVEPSIDEHSGSNIRYFDIVSSDHFARYLDALVNDSLELSKRLQEHDEVLYAGVGLLKRSDANPEPPTHEILEKIPEEYEEFPEIDVIGSIQRSLRSTRVNLIPEALQNVPEDTVLTIDIGWDPEESTEASPQLDPAE